MALPLIHINRRLDWVAQERRNKLKRRAKLFPEGGATAETSFNSGDEIANPENTFNFSVPTLFGLSIVFNEGDEGVIFGTGTFLTSSSLVAVYNDNLIIRCGSALIPPVDGQARLVVPLSALPRGRLCRLSWMFRPHISELMRVKAWVNGKVIGIAESVIAVAAWSAAGIGGFDAVPGTVAVEADANLQAYTSSGSAIVGEMRVYTGFQDGI